MVDNAEGITGTAPDWLPISTPPSRKSVAGEIPDWLPAQSSSGGTAAALAAIPDWLPAEPRAVTGRALVSREGAPISLEEAVEPVPPAPEVAEESEDLFAQLREEPVTPSAPSVTPPAPSEPESEVTKEETPDWMAGLDLTPTDTPPRTGAGVTGWLRGLDPIEKPSGPPPPDAELPDFLKEPILPRDEPSDGAESDLPDFLKESSFTADVPDWMAALDVSADQPGDVGGDLADLLLTSPEAGLAPAPKVELPDFLKDMEGIPPQVDLAAEPLVSEQEVPDWMAGLSMPVAPPAEPASEPGISPPAAVSLDVATPDWMADLEAGAAAVETAPAEAEPAAPSPPPAAADVPDWMADLDALEAPAQETTEEPAPAAITPEADVPDWLAGLAETPAMPPAAEPESAAGGSLAWLESLDFGGELESLPSVDVTGEDLLGLTGAMAGAAPSEEGHAPEGEADVEAADLPAWMQSLRQQQSGETPVVPVAPVEVEPELADQIGDLRYESILGGAEEKASAEKVGALKELSGVIRPEIIFEGETLRVEGLVDEIIVTKDQARKIQRLNNLLFGETTGVSVGERGPGLPVIRWVVALLLLVAVALPPAAGLRILPDPGAPSDPILDARTTIAELPADSTVLIAFEYESESAGEMEPIAVALLDHLAESDNIQIYALSTHTTGPAMIESAFMAADPAQNRLNLGYVAGGPNGIRNLAGGTLPDIPSPLSFDYRGESTEVEAGSLIEANIDLVIVLAARWEYLQSWIEQAGTIIPVPMVAGTSAAAAPMAYPYKQSGQLAAVLSGVNDAAVYQLTGGNSLTRPMAVAWNAQAIAGIVAAVVIVVGGILFGLGARRSQQEGE